LLGAASPVAFVGSSDPNRARDFYEGVLGLPLLGESPFAVVFGCGEISLRVAIVEEVVAAPYTVLGWEVEDIAATVAALTGRGIEFERYPEMDQDDSGVWEAPGGARVAWFKDPDGNVLSFSQT
jgi:catechol 2,3-dioxygenase-like lactoylglutathione lyase family enzyme